MKILVANQFDLQPRPGQSPRDCLSLVRGVVADWVYGIFRSLGVHDLHLPFDGSCISLQPSHELRSDDHDCASHRLATLEWEFPEAPQSPLIWTFSATLACDARAVQAALLISTRWRTYVMRPLQPVLGNPNPLSSLPVLRDNLLDGWNCRIGGQPIPRHYRQLNKGQVDSFVREELCNPSRVLPVILFLLGGLLNVDADALRIFQNHVTGLAHVVALSDKPSAERMARQLGIRFAEGHVMHLYWPGFTRDGGPDPKAWTIDQIQQALQKAPLHILLQEMLLPISGEFREGAVIRAARAALLADRRARRQSEEAVARLEAVEADLQQVRQAHQVLKREAETAQRYAWALLGQLADLREEMTALRAATKPPTDLTPELEKAWEENERLKAEYEATREQLAELEEDFRNYLASTALGWEGSTADVPAPDMVAIRGRNLRTVADALRAAAVEHADILRVWEDAEHSAEESQYANPARVYQALEGIAEVGRAVFAARNNGVSMGPLDQAFAQRIPFKYACFESRTTRNLFGGERIFHHQGQSRQMQRHLTLGGGSTTNCLQIYFDFDDESHVVLIGYCGKHLPYSSQRT